MNHELTIRTKNVCFNIFRYYICFIINFIRKFNKKPEGLENIPYISFISLLKILWAYFQQKNYDEVEDLVQELIGGHHDIYLSQFGIVLNNPEYAKILLTESGDLFFLMLKHNKNFPLNN
ncbi:unnamed protein product [Rhizophagus irregularis]|nr:unnamed protein product [Rhizophagus irregularis]